MIYIANAFSLSMLPEASWTDLVVRTIRDPAAWLCAAEAVGTEVVSAVGHADTAGIFSGILGIPVDVNRVSIALAPGVRVLVGQYAGPRLPEGATELPEGASIRWMLVYMSSGWQDGE